VATRLSRAGNDQSALVVCPGVPRIPQESHSMKESIRNQLPGIVKSIVSDKVLSEVIVDTSSGDVASVITTHSVEEMKLKPGDKVFVLIKATNVSLRRGS
jgi:molybdopterin-binding protein